MKVIIFNDYPQFTPNLPPKQIMEMGSFGGTYWRDIHSTILNKDLVNYYKKYKWLNEIDIDNNRLAWNKYNKNYNRYSVKVGSRLEEWEDKGWISHYHPYGWFEWYCDFYNGKRCEDDTRQINRWIRTAGKNSRFRKRLINMIHNKNLEYDDISISPKIRQTLQHWGYILTKDDYLKAMNNM